MVKEVFEEFYGWLVIRFEKFCSVESGSVNKITHTHVLSISNSLEQQRRGYRRRDQNVILSTNTDTGYSCVLALWCLWSSFIVSGQTKRRFSPNSL